MFKDYLFFSNNLQDAAKQILEAQEAQAKKENVEEDEAVEPGPNEPMGQPVARKWFSRPPSYEDDPSFVGPPAPTEKPLLHLIPDKNVPNEKDDEMWEMKKWNKERERIMQRQDAPAIEAKNRIEDQKEKRRYDKEVEHQERVRRQGKDNGIPMDELA